MKIFSVFHCVSVLAIVCSTTSASSDDGYIQLRDRIGRAVYQPVSFHELLCNREKFDGQYLRIYGIWYNSDRIEGSYSLSIRL